MTYVGLRIDVDTIRGTTIGVPKLLGLLKKHKIRASFFFTVGPDNMGRHLWRLIRPAFLFKMLRTKAAKLYGWDIIWRGTFWPGPLIGKRCREIIKSAADDGHETGLHAWDHHYWQTRIDSLSQSDIKAEIQKGGDLLTDILGKIPDCFAAPAWQTTTNALLALNEFSFRFQSDCRGHSVFRPDIDGLVLKNIQVPATLPTYDELIGLNCTEETYNEYLLNLIRPDKLNILTIHAEVEGIHCFNLFQKFLDMARQKNIVLVPMGEMIPEESEINISTLLKTSQPGREGWLSIQEHYE